MGGGSMTFRFINLFAHGSNLQTLNTKIQLQKYRKNDGAFSDNFYDSAANAKIRRLVSVMYYTDTV